MKLTTTTPITASRFHRRSAKGSSYKKLFTSHQKSLNGSKREILRDTSPCDNSDDSGLGTENNADCLYNTAIPHPSVFRFANSQKRTVDDSFSLNSKRNRVDGKEQHDLGDPYSPTLSHVTLSNLNSICVSPGMQTSVPTASKAIRRSLVPAKRLSGPVTLSSSLSATSRNGKVCLQILNQPEQQHRARYQTEGSRGAVKDRTGNSFPIVKIVGYHRLTTLQVFIGSDQGRVTPHMFYQACRVTGKNSTPCVEKNIDGTIVIEIDVEPSKDMTVTCDCVGILKERNVDVEHRFPEECSTRSKKKSTRCRMVFRTTITNDDGTTETLQVASQPIACTQPPGIPEICKKSLTSSSVSGDKELFILGKNFLKDTHVRFYTDDWEQLVTPDKEFLQQTHLVCVVPAYKNLDISEVVNAKITVVSGNRASEPHTFTYTPVAPVVSPVAPLALTANPIPRVTNPSSKNDSGLMKPEPSIDDPNEELNQINENTVKTSKSPTDDCENVHPVMLWPASNLSSPTTGNCSLIQNDSKMMPPPALPPRRSSVQMIVPDSLSSSNMKADVPNAGPGIVSHFPNTAGSQLPNSVTQHAYSPPQYPTISDSPTMISDYTSTYRTMSDLDSSLKSNNAVPKIEPLSDSPNMCANAYPASPITDIQSPQMCISNMKNTAAIRASQASDLYSNSHCYAYATSDMYSPTNKNESKACSLVEDLSVFVNPRSASTALPSDSLGLMGGSNVSGMMLQSTPNVLNSNDTSNYVVSQSFQINSVVANSNVLSTNRSSYPKNDSKMLMVNLSDSSSYNQNVKRKPFQLDKLFDMKSQQSLVSCSSKNSSSYENIRNAICYKNPPSTESSVVPMYQNYLNLENTPTFNSSEDMLPSYGKLDENKSVASMDVVKSSMMLENTASSLMHEASQTARKNSQDYILPVSKTYSTKSLNGGDDSSYLNSQSQESVMNEFVTAPVADNAINTVPKLEELVNCAAESHMRSANKSASLNLLNNSSISNSNCDHNSIQLDMFLNNETSQGGNCNGVYTALSPSSRTNCVSENPLLVRKDELASYQQATNASRSTLEMSNVANKPPDALELKKEKTVNVPGMSKKTEEGVFSSEIIDMTENDLLSYINPSCFDEGNIFILKGNFSDI